MTARSDSWTDRPPPSWKKSTSFIKVNADSGADGWSSPSSPTQQPQQPNSPGQGSAFKPSSLQLPIPAAQEMGTASPNSPKGAWETGSQAQYPTTPRLPPPPVAAARSDSATGAALERQPSHRKTTSWGGGASPTAAGRGHRRTRSIEGLGASLDASETFRAELERIGSLGSGSLGSPSGQSIAERRPSLALSPPRAPLQAPPQPVSRRSSVGSPLKQPVRRSSDGVPPLNLAPIAAKQQAISAVKRPGKEQELISWEEVKDQKDVYQAIRTADGRQALVRAGDGTGQEELLYLEDPPRAAQDASAAQGPQAPAVFYVPMAAGQGPLYAYPVQYPDGRIMYHILPPQGLSPMSSPHAMPAHVASLPYPSSPTAASTPPGHQRRRSVGSPSPLQMSSSTAFGSASYGTTFGSGSVEGPLPHMYAHSSGALSPQLLQATSGQVQGASPNHQLAMSPTASGHLLAPASFYSQPAYSSQANHKVLLEQLAGMRLAAAKDDPFGASAVWAT